MTVIDAGHVNFPMLSDCWFPAELNNGFQLLTVQERQAAIAWINANIFDAAKVSQTGRMNVTTAIRAFLPMPPDWTGSPLQPLYDRTGQDDERAAKLYGNLVCRVGVGRPEIWWCFPEPVAEDRFSRTYVLSSKIAAVLNSSAR